MTSARFLLIINSTRSKYDEAAKSPILDYHVSPALNAL